MISLLILTTVQDFSYPAFDGIVNDDNDLVDKS